MGLTAPVFAPVLIKGLKVDPQNPFQFDFLMDTGDMRQADLDARRLIKYFLASLTLPEKDLWVNLSPYEKDRMITPELGQTQMGRDMLAQDQVLKQLAASSIDPHKDLGKAFWDRVYAQARAAYGTEDIPMDMFNKVWVLADEARVFQQGNTAHIVSAHMKVMLESDYLAAGKSEVPGDQGKGDIGKQVFRDIVVPELEKEVNTGKEFVPLRQIFYSFILATWFKKNIRQALLNQVYSDQKKVASMEGGAAPEVVYQKYLEAYRSGAFNFIQEEVDPSTGDIVPRKYFSGGEELKSDHIQVVDDAQELTGDEKKELGAADVVVTARVDPFEDAPLKKEDWKELMKEGMGLVDQLTAAARDISGTESVFRYKFRDGIGNGLGSIKSMFSLVLSGDIFLQKNGMRSPEFVMAGIKNALRLLEDDVYRQSWMQWAPEGLERVPADWKTSGELRPDAPWVKQERERLAGFKAVYEQNAARLNKLIDFIYDTLAADPPEGVKKTYMPPDYEMTAYMYEFFPNMMDITKEDVKTWLGLITPDDDEMTLRNIYRMIEDAPHGVGRAIYDALYNHMAMDLVEVEDLVKAAKVGAREYFKACKQWMATKGQDPQARMKLVFATGKSPEMMYKFIADHLKMDWTDPKVRDLLRAEGIDPDHKPDMSRVISFHLDTVLPQKRDAYFSFSNIVGKWADAFNIPADQQFFFHGDVALAGDGRTLRAMTPEEFAALRDDVALNGLKVKDFVAGRLDEKKFPVQHSFFKVLQVQNEQMTAKLKDLGGPDIVFGSVGPSNEGQGHVAFVEAENIDEVEAFMAEANHHIIASQAGQGGGYQRLEGGMGVATFSLADITQNKDAKFILIILDSKKKTTVQRGIEGSLAQDKDAPLVRLQGAKGALIIDGGSGSELLINTYPWDFEILPQDAWTDELRREFFIRSALRIGKKLEALSAEDVLSFEKDKTHPIIQWIRAQNMEAVLKAGSFDDQKKAIVTRLAANTIHAGGLAEKLWGKAYVDEFNAAQQRFEALVQSQASEMEIAEARAEVDRLKKIIVCVDPHPDDRFLADPGAFEELIAQGHRIVTITATPGASSVGDQLAVALVSHMSSLTQEQIEEARRPGIRRVLTERLKDLVQQERPFVWDQRLDFNVWEKMGRSEQDLRAQLLFSYLDQKVLPGRFVKEGDLKDLVAFLKGEIALRPEWGAASLQLLDEIKSRIRVIEEKTAMLAWGVAYEDIYDPVKPSWYSSIGKMGTASVEDIVNMVELFEKVGRIDAVLGNGEGFSDFDAHSSTEATVIATLFALDKQGLLDHKDFRYVTYAGVWERIAAGEADLTILYSKDEVDRLHRRFWQFYLSQAPTQQPDAAYDKLMIYSESVVKNGEVTAAEFSSLMGAEGDIADILTGGGIALNFQTKDIFDPRVRASLQAKIDKLEEVGTPLKETSVVALYGALPSKDSGGILLDAGRMKLETQGRGEPVQFRVDPALIARYRSAPGLVPVILGIRPAQRLNP